MPATRAGYVACMIRARPLSTRRVGLLALAALPLALGCEAPRGGNDETIDPLEAQPREKVEKTDVEKQRDARFEDRRRRRPGLDVRRE